jgi:hypothetical protein
MIKRAAMKPAMMKLTNQRRHRGREQGSAMLEAIMMLMLTLICVLSLFDFGFSLFLHESYVHEARLGARYGAVNPADLTAIKNVVLYNSTTGSGTGHMGLPPSAVTVARNGTFGGPDDRIVVTISGYNFTWLAPVTPGKKTGKPIVVTMPVEN